MEISYSSDLEEVLLFAENVANETSCMMDTVHLLTALCAVRTGYTSQILEKYGITEEIARSYFITSSERTTTFVSPVCEKVLLLAKQFSLQDLSNHCTSLHLLLALCSYKDCTAHKILLKYNLTVEKLQPICKTLQNKEVIIPKEVLPVIEKKEDYSKFGLFIEGKDIFIGREKELDRIIRVLSRKKKNNPILIGDSGVGKSAILYGFVQKIKQKKVPSFLENKKVLLLDTTKLLSGTKYRGDLEEKIEELFRETVGKNIILAIDDLQSLLSVNTTEANGITALLKPIMLENIPFIGTACYDSYTKLIEADPSLERRFTPIFVEEPNEEYTEKIVESHKEEMEKHFGVKIYPSAIKQTILLSKKYLPELHFPDKAIDVLEESCGKNAIDGKSTVQENDIRQIIQEMTGIPSKTLSESDKEKLRDVQQVLSEKIIGQMEATTLVANVIKRSYIGIKSKNKPIASFLFIGPTGVGKTETAKVLAEILFGKKEHLIRFDMSEYSEKNDIAKLIGSPPGYVGYEEGGTLTEAVRKKNYAVVLLDEIEKAHPDICNILLQVLDDGRLTDGKGRTVHFENTIIIMTGNIGTKEAIQKEKPVGFTSEKIDRVSTHLECVKNLFPPEFINRIDNIVVFNKLGKEELRKIANNIVEGVQKTFLEEKQISLQVDEEIYSYLAELVDGTYGARPLQKLIETEINDKIGEMILNSDIKNCTVEINLKNGKPNFTIKERKKCV